ncbi:hypothetical protein [Methanoculleus horonobensis]|uniref:hypothetical protein n=1 Tax=Methanoculleus horonobensis TaxID=528314 RepID=UPI00082D339C|nr:hypothetical protein [Methanoculleus horonobensis]MDD3071487.1 hypothetical protein [Methanoculleus horonobensis]
MTTETEKKPDRIVGVLGALFGLFLYYVWIAVLMAILFTFFAEPNAMGAFIVEFSQMVQVWLSAGMLPVFITLGYHLFARDTMPEAERLLGRAGLAASASGFLLWLLVLAALEVSGVAVEYPYYVAGGYVFMLILGVFFWKTWSRGV